MMLYSPAKKIGELLAEELKNNPHFYFFSPDETTSNKFDKVFEVEKRAWALPTETWDLPESKGGRIVEMLYKECGDSEISDCGKDNESENDLTDHLAGCMLLFLHAIILQIFIFHIKTVGRSAHGLA